MLSRMHRQSFSYPFFSCLNYHYFSLFNPLILGWRDLIAPLLIVIGPYVIKIHILVLIINPLLLVHLHPIFDIKIVAVSDVLHI